MTLHRYFDPPQAYHWTQVPQRPYSDEQDTSWRAAHIEPTFAWECYELGLRVLLEAQVMHTASAVLSVSLREEKSQEETDHMRIQRIDIIDTK
jgi:hypothetical protein